MDANKINDLELSCEGINRMINNDWRSCEELFTQYKDYTPLMNYCSTFMSFMKALMSFEDNLMEQSAKDLEETEKLCTPNGSNKMASALRKAFGMSRNNSTTRWRITNENTVEDKFTKQIIVADCKLYSAILTFIRQEGASTIGAAIIQLRAAWKTYSRVHKQLYDLFKKLDSKADLIYGTDPSSLHTLWIEESEETGADDENNNRTTQDLNEKEISLDSVKRLLGAVCFGYGIFQICLSFLPPNLLKLIKIFGFEGDRTAALKAILFTSKSKDMRAPFADMILLWYETFAKPLNGEIDVAITNNEIEQIIEKNMQKYPKSSLFLYFKGKYNLTIKKDLNASSKCFMQAIESATETREIQLISVYQLGWNYLTSLNYDHALKCFERLSEESKWSQSFHAFVCALLFGALGKFEQAHEHVKEGLDSVTRRKNPVEMFAQTRLEFLKKNNVRSQAVFEFFIVEMNFLWVCLPYCQQEHLAKMLQIIGQIDDKNLLALKCMLEGVVQWKLDNKTPVLPLLEEAISKAHGDKSNPFSKYIQASAHHQIGLYKLEEGNYKEAKQYVTKARDNYSDYDFESRLSSQMSSALRKIDVLCDKSSPKKQMRDEELKSMQEKKVAEDNFYL